MRQREIFLLFFMLSLLILVLMRAGNARAEQSQQSQNQSNTSQNLHERLGWAEAQLSTFQSLSFRLMRDISQARQDGDQERARCLNNTLTRLNVTIRSFERRLGEFRTALRQRNSDRAHRQHRMLLVLSERGRFIRAEVDICQGNLRAENSQTTVTTTSPSNLPDDRVLDRWLDDSEILRPAPASGYY